MSIVSIAMVTTYSAETQRQSLLRQIVAIKTGQRFKTDDDFKLLVRVLKDLKVLKDRMKGIENGRH